MGRATKGDGRQRRRDGWTQVSTQEIRAPGRNQPGPPRPVQPRPPMPHGYGHGLSPAGPQVPWLLAWGVTPSSPPHFQHTPAPPRSVVLCWTFAIETVYFFGCYLCCRLLMDGRIPCTYQIGADEGTTKVFKKAKQKFRTNMKKTTDRSTPRLSSGYRPGRSPHPSKV